nr:metal ABC transporter ATP-binding protein [Bacteroides intestinalis]
MNTPLIEIKNLSAGYDSRTVLRNVNLTVYDRDFLGIIGPNGGGKTTLIKCILGLLKPTAGEILYSDKRFVTSDKQGSAAQRPALTANRSVLKMGYLPQYNSIDRKFPITVEEVILSGLSSQKSLISRFTATHREKARQVIARMGLEGLEKRAIGALSGGQLQRALLGRAIISDPALVVLDEPSTYIDRRFEARLYELLAEINHDCAIILVSHDIGTVLQQVKSIACVNETLDYHPDTGVSEEWLERNFNCPIELLGHGALPHRILAEHKHGDECGCCMCKVTTKK